jgi:hypothetical protein
MLSDIHELDKTLEDKRKEQKPSDKEGHQVTSHGDRFRVGRKMLKYYSTVL